MGWSQNDVCLKCNEGGNLLTCSECPLVIHDGCMRCVPKFDDLGNFYCPHCSFKRSIAELSQARKNVKLTRKALSIFMGVESNNEADPEHCEKSREETNASLNNSSVRLEDDGKIRDADEGEETGNVEGEKILEEESETPLSSNDQIRKENSETYEESTDKGGEETGNVEGENIQEEESETHLSSNDQIRKENSKTYEASTDTSGEREISSKDKNLIGEEDSTGGHRSTGHVRAKRRALMSKSSCEDTPARKKHVKQSSRAVKRKLILPRAHSAQVTNKSADEEFDDSGSESKEWIHPKHLSVKLDNNIGNKQSGRVFWTEEEVEMLKAGVEKYLPTTKQNIPWKKILKFGHGVFNKTRDPDNLREKWKTIRKKT